VIRINGRTNPNSTQSDTVRKRFSLIVLALTFLFNALPLFARLVRPWSLQEIFDKADLVVVATFLSTQDTQERSTLQDVDPALKVIGLTSEFKVEVVFKGPKNLGTLRLHHYKFQDENDARRPNGPLLIRLPTPPQNGIHYAGHGAFLMFLLKETDGSYAPVTGQTDPALSVLSVAAGI